MGLEGDLLGRKVLGLPASAPVVVVVAEVVETVEVMAGVEAKIVLSIVTIGTSSGSSDITT